MFLSEGAFVPCVIDIKGMKGGHSGMQIHEGRPNAIKIIARILQSLKTLDVRISSIKAGEAHNAIPQNARAIIFLPKENIKQAESIVEKWVTTVKDSYKEKTGKFSIRLRSFPRYKMWNKTALTFSSHERLLKTLLAFPHGVIKMSEEMTGLVETSANLAVLRVANKKATILASARSATDTGALEVREIITSILFLGGFSFKLLSSYRGWQPDLRSPLLLEAKEIYEKLFKEEPKITAIHAGFECGIIGLPFMLALGPTIKEVHSPNENISIESVAKFWKFLTALLASLDKIPE